MERIRNSSLLRGICYILIPITVFILLISIANEVLISEYGEISNEEELIETGMIRDNQEFVLMQKIYNLFKNYENSGMYCIPICTILFVAMIIYLFWSIGHEKDGITLGSIDKIPYELLIIAGGFIVFILAEIVVSISDSWAEISINIITSVYILSYLGAYASLLAICVTTIRRIKAKEFWHSFLIYKIWNKIKTTTQKIARNFADKTKSTKKLTFYYLGFLAICAILISMSGTFLGVLLLLGFLGWTFYKMLEYNKKINKIQEALRDIYEGKNDVHLNEEELQGVLKQMAKYINDIAGGFSNAIEQSLKSERLKTELITNVSHDIKTPLTSITKYAMDGTRVYIELKKQDAEIELSIKNISSEKLNISADELMQRFARGDRARHTEGSGLGLSIARSLTELQGGSFFVEIDGDLFKVWLRW